MADEKMVFDYIVLLLLTPTGPLPQTQQQRATSVARIAPGPHIGQVRLAGVPQPRVFQLGPIARVFSQSGQVISPLGVEKPSPLLSAEATLQR